MIQIIKIDPVAKPRMTRRDKWAKRPAVLKYRDFCDLLRLHRVRVPEKGATIRFYLPMPKSWGEKKKALLDGYPHQAKPDLDNLIKAVLDAIYEDDSIVWQLAAEKYWGREGRIEIEVK